MILEIFFWIFAIIGMGVTVAVTPLLADEVRCSRKKYKHNQLMANIARLEIETGVGLLFAKEWLEEQEPKVVRYHSGQSWNLDDFRKWPNITPLECYGCGKTYKQKYNQRHPKLCMECEQVTNAA